MDDLRPLVCPVLVGRGDLLAMADGRLDEVRNGNGQLLLVADEAGLGKTRLLGSSARLDHISTKLGVRRRAEIAAWTALRPVLHSPPHGDDREE